MRGYRLSPAAVRDLRSIREHYLQEAGREIADRILSGLRSKCRMIAQTPGEIGRRRDEIRPEIRSFPVRPHVIFFRFRADAVEVVRILHQRQDVDSARFE